MDRPSVTVWNEHVHEREDPHVAGLYPEGLHGALAAPLRAAGLTVGTATLEQPGQGLPAATLAVTDVLLWWGHRAHEAVEDGLVDRLQQAVLAGMGLLVLHSGHYSKIFRRLMGTSGSLHWRDAGESEHLWCVAPGHPIAAGLGRGFRIPAEETYGEPFDIPAPDELVLVSGFAGGDVFRSGCCYYRGKGRVFYFRPGDQTYPTYHQPEVQRVLLNAVRWAAPRHGRAQESA